MAKAAAQPLNTRVLPTFCILHAGLHFPLAAGSALVWREQASRPFRQQLFSATGLVIYILCVYVLLLQTGLAYAQTRQPVATPFVYAGNVRSHTEHKAYN